MKKRILISTGGSGGHVVPGTIFYEHLQDKFDIFMISDLRGLNFLNKDKYNMEILDITRISRNIFLLPFQIFLIFYSLLRAVLILKKNKQEVVYLKPKGSAKQKTKKDKNKSEIEEPVVAEATQIDETPIAQAPTNPYATMAFEDENVIRAELKALRQSAVSMSVNQREGATQIVKDWLSDGASDSETEGEEG